MRKSKKQDGMRHEAFPLQNFSKETPTPQELGTAVQCADLKTSVIPKGP